MKTQLSNVVPIGSIGSLVLIIKEEDVEKSGAQCVQLDMNTGESFFFTSIDYALKFSPFEEIVPEQREFFREEIYRRVKDSAIVQALTYFENENN